MKRDTYLLLRHALLLCQGAPIELAHHLVLKEVAASNLAPYFVLFSIASVETDDIGQALAVKQAPAQLKLTVLQQARTDLEAISSKRRQGHKGRP